MWATSYLMRTLEQGGAHTWPWWGPRIERFMEDAMLYGLIRVL